jgi:hypothetical protein
VTWFGAANIATASWLKILATKLIGRPRGVFARKQSPMLPNFKNLKTMKTILSVVIVLDRNSQV